MDHDGHHRLKARAAGKPAEPPPESDEWEPPILKAVAAKDEGLDALMAAIARTAQFLERTGQRAERERARARMQFLALLREPAPPAALARLEREKGRLDEVAARIAAAEADPYALAETLAGSSPAEPMPAPSRPPDAVLVDGLEAKAAASTCSTRCRGCAALTHKSYCNEHRGRGSDNERLEFLGDAVVDLAVSHRLMERFPAADEGELSKLRAPASSTRRAWRGSRGSSGSASCSAGPRRGPDRRPGQELRAGRRARGGHRRGLPERGPALVLELVDRLFGDRARGRGRRAAAGRTTRRGFKKMVQTRLALSPRYRVVSEEGPDHSKTFEVEVTIGAELYARARGRSKKEAEQAAARETLTMLESGEEGARRALNSARRGIR